MKNKKHFLFTKIDKETIKDTKVKQAIKLTLAFSFIFSLVMQLIGCISLSANAWDYNYYDEPQVSDSPTVEVVDELPTSPSANVIYIINTEVVDDSVVGTWVFNEILSLPALSNESTVTYNINFSSSGVDFSHIKFYRTNQSPYYTTSLLYGESAVYDDRNNLWSNSNFKTITITGGTDISNETFISWLKANAVKQGVTSTLITTYNVYINSSWHTFDNLPQAVNSLFDGSSDSFIGSLLDSNGLLHQDIINWGDDKYERGYEQGLNDDLGKEVVLGFLSAPRDFLSNVVLFEVAGVSISIWSIFTTILGVTLFIWFLKVFAGG